LPIALSALRPQLRRNARKLRQEAGLEAAEASGAQGREVAPEVRAGSKRKREADVSDSESGETSEQDSEEEEEEDDESAAEEEDEQANVKKAAREKSDKEKRTNKK